MDTAAGNTETEAIRTPSGGLSFINGREYWQPVRGTDYTQDCFTGQVYADELVEHLQNGGMPNIMGSVMRAMIAGKRYGGVEIGFCQRIAEHLAK